MNPYDRYPGIDSDYNFPQEVREALANSLEITKKTSGQIEDSLGNYDKGLRDDLKDYSKIDLYPPRRPAKPILSLAMGAVIVRATGKSYAGPDMDEDLDHYRPQVDSNDGKGFVNEGAPVSAPDGSIEIVGKPAGPISVRLVAVDTSGNASDPGESETITVIPIETAEAVRADYEAAQGRIDETIADFAGTVNQAVEKAESAEEAATAAESRATEANNRAMTRLANGNFEDGLKYWIPAEGIELAAVSHSGVQSALIKGSAPLVSESAIPVVQSQIWEIQLHYRPVTNGAIVVSLIDNNGVLHGTTTVSSSSSDRWLATGAVRVTIPENIDGIRPHVTKTGGWFYVDDVAVRDVTDVVRLENAANAARQKAETAEARAIAVELVQGGIDRRLADNERILTEAGVEGANNLATLDQRLTNAFKAGDTTAQAAAIAAAAADATAKKEQAEANAAADAKAKADAALAAAKTDATTKSNAAETAAKTAAAADAKAKVEAAEARSASDAKAKADAALAAAKSDAAAKAAAAELAATTAAAADAKAKVEAAEYRAATEALRVAKAEATREANEAEEAAKQYAAAQASGASGSALAAAKAYAEEQAEEARIAAEKAAAADATTKKELAEANAAKDAKIKADAALASAKSDATAKANEAERLAKLAAAADATAKKEQAEANAAADAKAKADAALAAAKSDATTKANEAERLAKVAAAADAKAKVEAAEARAAADAKAKADAALATAKSDATTKDNAVKSAAAADAQTKLDQARAEIDAGLNLVNNYTKSGNMDRWSAYDNGPLVDVDFNGRTVKALKIVSNGNGQAGYSSWFDVDPTKAYEVSVWTKHIKPAGSTGRIHMGTDEVTFAGEGSAVTAISAQSGHIGAENSNFYFHNTVSQRNDTWVRWVAYILPYSRGVDGYYVEAAGLGEEVGSHAMMRQDTDRMLIRFLNYYNSSVASTLYLVSPTVTETTIGAIQQAHKAKVAAEAAHAAAGTAQSTANAAITSANGKNAVMRDTSAPSGNGTARGDVWWQFKNDTYTEVAGQWTWSGSVWTKSKLSHETISSVDIGTLTVVGSTTLVDAVAKRFYADMVAANEVFARKMVISEGNLFPDPNFENGISGWTVVNKGIEKTGNGYQAGSYALGSFKVKAGDEFLVEVDRKTLSGTRAANQVRWIGRVEYTDGTTGWPVAWIDSEGANRDTLKITKDGVLYLGFFLESGATSSVKIRLENPRVLKKTGTVLLEDGAVRANNIVADESMTTKIFGAENGVIKYLTATQKALFLAGLDAIGESWIDGVNIKNKAITAALMNFITTDGVNNLILNDQGFMLRRIANNRLILTMNESGFKGYDPRNTSTTPTFSIDPATGKVTAVGMEAVDIIATGEFARRGVIPGEIGTFEVRIMDGSNGPGVYFLDPQGRERGAIGFRDGGTWVTGTKSGPTADNFPRMIAANGTVTLASETTNVPAASSITISPERVEIVTGDVLEIIGNTIRAGRSAGRLGDVVTANGWKEIPKRNGWGNVTGRPAARYQIVGNEIHFSGSLSNGNSGYFGNINTVADRPNYSLDTSIIKVNSQEVARLTVYSDGRLETNVLTNQSGTYLSLDGAFVALN